MGRKLSICIINPLYLPSYWGREYALPLYPGDKRAWTAGGALPLLAALTPDEHEIVLIDESVEPIDFASLARFDIVGLTGMIVQRNRMLEILEELAKLPVITALGGPYVSIDESFFEGTADCHFIGEADTTWPEFVNQVSRGETPARRWEQTVPTDMETLPIPHHDLLKRKHYLSASMQFSRGCPFRCEFCDIIVIFGRRPRLKTPSQVIAELDDLLRSGYSYCFMVDDNFIGNKPAAKELLTEIVAWQRENNYAMVLSTEATVNMADDPDLLKLLVDANFRSVFIGLESPRPEALKEMLKTQNLRGDSMPDKLARVREAGIVVTAGFIAGFDSDDVAIFDEQIKFIKETMIAQASMGILMALPKTPLFKRLVKEGRIRDDGHMCNFEPKNMTREELTEGVIRVIGELYQPEAFFHRVFENIAAGPRLQTAPLNNRDKSKGMLSKLSKAAGGFWFSAVLGSRLIRALYRKSALKNVGRQYISLYFQAKKLTPLGLSPAIFLHLCALHWHVYRLSILDISGSNRSANIYDAPPVEARNKVTPDKQIAGQ